MTVYICAPRVFNSSPSVREQASHALHGKMTVAIHSGGWKDNWAPSLIKASHGAVTSWLFRSFVHVSESVPTLGQYQLLFGTLGLLPKTVSFVPHRWKCAWKCIKVMCGQSILFRWSILRLKFRLLWSLNAETRSYRPLTIPSSCYFLSFQESTRSLRHILWRSNHHYHTLPCPTYNPLLLRYPSRNRHKKNRK